MLSSYTGEKGERRKRSPLLTTGSLNQMSIKGGLPSLYCTIRMSERKLRLVVHKDWEQINTFRVSTIIIDDMLFPENGPKITQNFYYIF